MAIEIKSSLLNASDMKNVKRSLIHVSEKDGESDFRVKLIEYINDTCENNQDMFFYDALEYLRFLNPGSDDVAFTTPDKLIFLNAPGYKDIGKKIRIWEFVYDHECLHQLWDTFGVGDKIKKEKGSYDHQILNIASDCVINDYLYRIRKKEKPAFGIFPDVIKKEFGVDYDAKKDTQYTLYFKLLEVKEKIKKEIENNPDLKKLLDDMEQQGGGSGQSGQSGESGQSDGNGQSGENQQGGSEGQSSQNQPNNAEGAEQAAKEAQTAAEKAKKESEKAGNSGDEDADEKDELAKEAQEAAEKAKEAAEKSKEAKENGDKEAEKEAAKEAKEQAQKAKDALNKIKGENGQDGKDDQNGKNGKEDKNGKNSKEGQNGKNGQDSKDGGGKGVGNGHADILESPEELEEIRKGFKDLLDKYGNKISGDFGEFIKKCKSSRDCNKNGLELNTRNGSNGWNEKMNTYVNSYVKKKVFQKKRQFQETYSRVRRGSGYVEYGQPIKPGKKIREEKLNITVAFYIDRSGSMSGCISQVFKACYVISESLKKKFKKEQVVDKVDFKIYAFDTTMIEIKYGNQCNAGGGTMGFHEILEFMNKNTDNFLINIIITDAQFDINNSEVEKFMKNIEGMLLFITNSDNSTMKNLSKKYETQLFYILADSNFEVK